MRSGEKVICKKELKYEKGVLKEGCLSVDQVFGYFSRKDGMRHRFDLCEDCYDRLIQGFALPVEETPETEFM